MVLGVSGLVGVEGWGFKAFKVWGLRSSRSAVAVDAM